jgi:protein-disulfide isomerase
MHRSSSRAHVVVSFAALLAGAVFSSCSAPCPPAAPAAGGAPPGAEVDEAACAHYQAAICAAAGEESEACVALGSAAEFLPPTACTIALADLDGSLVRVQQMRGVCLGLIERLCAAVGQESRGCNVIRQQADRLRALACREMAAHFDQVVGELRCIDREGQPLTAELTAALAAGDPPAFGPADAKATVVVFSDFQCPYCRSASTVIAGLRERYADRSVRVVFRQFPLDVHPFARIAAEASLEAAAQGRFWEFHDRVFARQEELDPITLEDLAGAVGLDVEAYRTALRDGTRAAAVDADMALAQEACVQGTPTVFVNGNVVRLNPDDPTAFYAAIDAALGDGADAAPAPAPEEEP